MDYYRVIFPGISDCCSDKNIAFLAKPLRKNRSNLSCFSEASRPEKQYSCRCSIVISRRDYFRGNPLGLVTRFYCKSGTHFSYGPPVPGSPVQDRQNRRSIFKKSRSPRDHRPRPPVQRQDHRTVRWLGTRAVRSNLREEGEEEEEGRWVYLVEVEGSI